MRHVFMLHNFLCVNPFVEGIRHAKHSLGCGALVYISMCDGNIGGENKMLK